MLGIANFRVCQAKEIFFLTWDIVERCIDRLKESSSNYRLRLRLKQSLSTLSMRNHKLPETEQTE
jgi:hypothetical protein